MTIHVHIERLVLESLPVSRAQAPQVKAAVEAELARRLAAEGLAPGLAQGGAVPSVRAPAIALAAASRPQAIGRQIATAIHGGLGT
jgi:hypothetical protein